MKTNPYKKKRINLYTLGCAKNVYDSEKLSGQLKAGNLTVVHDAPPKQNDVIVVNTCGFINDAKEESINSILEFVKARESGQVDELFVMGCLSERYKPDLEKEIPEVDRYFGVNELDKILDQFGVNFQKELLGERLLSTPKHYAFLKISDGCNHKCSFCAIPLIKGFNKSTPVEALVAEAEKLASKGVKELILIGQDTTYYGIDLYKEKSIVRLIEELSKVDGIEWIRLQYAYPAGFPTELLDLMNRNPKFCKYIDMPVQHFSDRMLRTMRRGVSNKKLVELLELFRQNVPGIAVRTTLIVGHPGETDDDFDEMLEFVNSYKFDRLGVFKYSHEEGTSAYDLNDDVPDEIKEERYNILMSAQQRVSQKNNEARVGKNYKVIIDRKEGEYFIGRTEYDTPEVDNEVLIKSEKALKQGHFYEVKITEATAYDLMAELID